MLTKDRASSLRRGGHGRYGAALTSVIAATGLRFLLWSILGEGVPFIFYFPAVVVSAWFGGLGPGLLSTLLGTLICWYVFIPPYYTFALTEPVGAAQLAGFLFGSVLIVLLAEDLHRARRRAGESERKEHEQREQLRVTLESIGDAVIATDLQGRVTFLNSVAESLTGWKQAEALGQELKTVFRIINEQTRQEVESPIVQVLRERTIVGLANHTLLIARDGAERPVADSGAPIRNDSGEIVGAVLVFRDISEQEHQKRALRDSEERFATAFAASPISLTITSLKTGRLLEVNETFSRVTGYSRDEAIGRTTLELSLWANPEDRAAELAMVAERGSLQEQEYRFRTKDGGEIVGLLSARRLEIGGEPCALTVIQDITARLEAERELRESEAYFRGLADAMPQLVWTARSDGSVEYYNSRQREYGGLSRQEKIGWDWQPIVHGEDLQMTLRAWRSAVQRACAYECEHRIRMADGSFRWHLSRAMPLKDDAGQVVKWFGTATDIHDLRESQQVLRENDRRKDEFLAMLAHELRNPLAPIRNAARVLRHIAPATAEVQQMREIIERQTAHLTRLVDDLLDVSRITRGKIMLQRERIELMSVITRAVETSRPLIDAARHRLTVTLPPQAVRIEGDLTRLAQVVANVLGNAAKYTENGGRIELFGEQQGDEVLIRIRDNGVGIPADSLPHIFDLFAQADRSLDRAQGGLGIGLTLARSLVEMHGGRIEARSDGPDRGSEFIIRLPAFIEPSRELKAQPDDLTQPSDNALLSQRRRILVVDDNIDSAESMAILLKLEGHEVRMVHDGPEAIRLAHEFRPHMLLLDIGLPGMNGYEVARALRESPESKQSVLIAITGYGQEEDRRRSKEAGFDHHLTKPVEHDQLSALIKSVLGLEP